MTEPWRGRRFASGEQLYAALGIPREDRPARLAQFAKNFDLFGAPVGLFFSIPRHFGPPQWAHLGMFIQTSCCSPRSAASPPARRKPGRWSTRRVADVLGLPEERMFYCGMALGYAADEAIRSTAGAPSASRWTAFATLQRLLSQPVTA